MAQFYQFTSIPALPRLSDEEEQALMVQAAQGDTEAQDRLVLSNIPFAIWYIKTIHTYHYSCTYSLEDLVQMAILGLIKASRRLDPSRKSSFTAFAFHCIHSELRNERTVSRRHTVPWSLVPEETDTTPSGVTEVTPESLMLEADEYEAIHRAMAELEPAQQSAIREYFGFTPDQDTTKTRQAKHYSRQRGLRHLRRKLKNYK